jgi:hypothetical protein
VRSLVFGIAALTGCAGHSPPPVAPEYAPVATRPASARAALYEGCLADAIAGQRVAQAVDADTSLLVFTCRGEPARAFYDGLAEWAAQQHSEFVYGGRTFRSTTRVRHDLFGVDYCATDGREHECVISLNAGAFLSTSYVY